MCRGDGDKLRKSGRFTETEPRLRTDSEPRSRWNWHEPRAIAGGLGAVVAATAQELGFTSRLEGRCLQRLRPTQPTIDPRRSCKQLPSRPHCFSHTFSQCRPVARWLLRQSPLEPARGSWQFRRLRGSETGSETVLRLGAGWIYREAVTELSPGLQWLKPRAKISDRFAVFGRSRGICPRLSTRMRRTS